jgi:hypothetical protein
MVAIVIWTYRSCVLSKQMMSCLGQVEVQCEDLKISLLAPIYASHAVEYHAETIYSIARIQNPYRKDFPRYSTHSPSLVLNLVFTCYR